MFQVNFQFCWWNNLLTGAGREPEDVALAASGANQTTTAGRYTMRIP